MRYDHTRKITLKEYHPYHDSAQQFSRFNANILPTATKELGKEPLAKLYRDYANADLKNTKKQLYKDRSESSNCTANVPIEDSHYILKQLNDKKL